MTVRSADRWINGICASAGGWLGGRGIDAPTMLLTGFVLSLAAAPLLATQRDWFGLGIWLGGRVLAAVAVQSPDTAERGRFDQLRTALDAIALGAVPFALALADPGHALAVAFLLFGFLAAISSGLAATRPVRAAMAVAVMLACLLPDWIGPIAYVLGLLGFAVTGLNVARLLPRRTT